MTMKTIEIGLEKMQATASDDKTRFNLNGVLIAKGLAVSTDGHCMTFARVDKETTTIEDGIYDFSGCKPKRDRKNFVLPVTVDDNGVGQELDAGKVVVTKIDGEFPDYRQVIPKVGETRLNVCFDAELLGKIIKAANSGEKKQAVTLSIKFDKDGECLSSIIVGVSGSDRLGILMPMKDPIEKLDERLAALVG